MADWRTAPLDPTMRAMLGFLEKLTLAPEALTHADLQRPRDAGLSDEAIEDAIHVCALFSIFTRIADSLAFEVPAAEAFARSAGILLSRGYK